MKWKLYRESAEPNEDGVLVIPDGTTEIEDEAYLGRRDIVRVEIPNSVTRIGKWAFSECPNL